MWSNRIIGYGISFVKKQKAAVLLSSQEWLETLERTRRAVGLENVRYEFWTYPSPAPEGDVWVKNNQTVLLFLSEGFLKVATESQVVTVMESLNAENFQETRRKNKQEAMSIFINGLKGESKRYRYWLVSFFVYPLERFLKIAKM